MAFKIGSQASVYITADAVTMTAQACSLVSGKTYRISTASRRVIDPTSTLTVLDNASPVSAGNIQSVDYLFGTVTFVPAYTIVGSITMTGNYLPLVEIATAAEASYSIDRTNVDVTSLGDTTRVRHGVMSDASGSLGLLEPLAEYDIEDGYSTLQSIVKDGTPIVIDIRQSATENFRARAVLGSGGQTISPDDITRSTIDWAAAGYKATYGWVGFSTGTV